MSEAEVQRRSITPLAKIIAFAQSGVEPTIMGIGPVSAVNKVVGFASRPLGPCTTVSHRNYKFSLPQMEKTGWTNDDVDLFELNEAFGVVAVAVSQQLGISQDKINIHGGAIALGHPLGASGLLAINSCLFSNRLKSNFHCRHENISHLNLCSAANRWQKRCCSIVHRRRNGYRISH